MARIIIGVDGSERSDDAIAFGRMLATASGAPVTVATAYPWETTVYHGVREYDDFLREGAEATLARQSEPLQSLIDSDVRALPDTSPARALQRLAEELDAGVIVVGSSQHGRLGRILPGSTGERLLHGAPCPIAVVPRGYAAAPARRPQTIACGWDGTPTSDAALATAEELARNASASLRVIRINEPVAYAYSPAMGPGYVELVDGMRQHARRELEQRVIHLAERVGAEAIFAEGDAADALVEISEVVDLIVVGSRGYGPLRAVMLGGVSGKVIRGAACPVIVVPRGASAGAASVFASAAHEVA